MGELERFAKAVAAGLRDQSSPGKDDLQRAKRSAMAEAGLARIPSDRAVAAALEAADRERLADALRTKPMRSQSGVAVVAVMSSPAACPHGKCTFCPGGPEVDAPQSYTGFEPSTLRARRHGYNPYHIVRDRLGQLQRNGHAIDKVDVVIQGGTFPARPPEYQDWFVAGIYAGLNAGPAVGADDSPGNQPGAWEAQDAWAGLPPPDRLARLAAVQVANESARCRAVGLTVETKPDWCFEPHLDRMLVHGATRVEIGVQTLDDAVLRDTHRGHTVGDTAKALQLARDAGFKVCAHLMPGLPRRREGTRVQDPDPVLDAEDFRRLFDEPAWRPDMLKVYPTLVVADGETPLKRAWERGEYHPYDSATAARVVADGKAHVPEWCRIQRIDRDIPTTHVEAGVMNTNLRQMAQADRAARGLPPCRCIRCREPGQRIRQGNVPDPARLRLRRTTYQAGGGTEEFLAYEDPVADALVAFLRLRKVGDGHRPETRHAAGSAVVRELKVYGTAKALGDDDPETGAFQHQGLGATLLREAERIAFAEWQVGILLVIAGPGVKPYYRRHGFTDLGPYVAKPRGGLGGAKPFKSPGA